MGRTAPAGGVAIVIEALAGLRRLQQEMARLTSHDDNDESNHRALQAAVRDLRGIISANVQ